MTRYAIYGVPGVEADAPAPAVALRDAVNTWYAAHPDITRDARRYGFHATLKAPFELAAGRTPDELETAVAAFATARRPVVLRQVRPAALGGFRAIVPAGDTTEIDELAADVVRGFEPFRAPLRADEIARRRPERLSARQRELLDEYGYPYVLNEFQVHLTITDTLEEPADDVDDAIARHFQDVAGQDVPLTSLALFVEPAPGEAFRIHSIHSFREATA